MCLALAACGGYQWVKPGMTSGALETDLTACGSRTSHLETDDPAAVAVVDRCMASRGYEKMKAR
jgi:hypothetical protein